SPRHQVDDIYIGAHSHAVSPGPNSHGNLLNPEYLSGVKNDV
ncbi:phage tail protein, partial [Salmonella enterica subsp. enterica serovar Newport]|nr:phage tail protein [Salmonella enterica subsp. enterica serovar Newport]EJG9199863.1 phage tail protein [Salmonella enterica subsp. enterica serovar Newport]EKE1071788.1 phage tail protein [Salmonella enterica subsp. enterica serovar Newport]